MNTHGDAYTLRPIGHVESPLIETAEAPKQGSEGAPLAWLVFEPRVEEGLSDLHEGDEMILLTWLHKADRDVLRVHPRGDPSRPERGVFSTRAPVRPNPIGLHRIRILAIEGARRVQVEGLEAVDGTPILDLKPVIGPTDSR